MPDPVSFNFETEGDPSVNVCVSKSADASSPLSFSSALCKTIVEGTKAKCVCDSLDAASVVCDIGNVFGKSYIGEVFSAGGLSYYI